MYIHIDPRFQVKKRHKESVKENRITQKVHTHARSTGKPYFITLNNATENNYQQVSN